MRNPADVLQATHDAFSTELNTRLPGHFPRRRSIQTGSVTYECDEMIVGGGPVYLGRPGERRGGFVPGGVAQYAIDVRVHLVRAHPIGDSTGAPPTVAALNAASIATGGDAAALIDAFWATMAANSIAGECDYVQFGSVEFAGPSGGLIGTVLSFSVQL